MNEAFVWSKCTVLLMLGECCCMVMSSIKRKVVFALYNDVDKFVILMNMFLITIILNQLDLQLVNQLMQNFLLTLHYYENTFLDHCSF